MPKLEKRNVQAATTKPASKPAATTAKPANAEPAKPSSYIRHKASTVAAQRYPLGEQSSPDEQYLAFIAKHAVRNTLDCVALAEKFPDGVPVGTYGNQTCAVNAGRIIRLVKLGFVTVTAGTDKAPLDLAFTAKAQAHKAYSANVGKA